MNEEIREILNDKDFTEIKDYIDNLQQENKRLKDNWNKLKKFVREELKEAEDDFAQEDFIKVLDRMQELEGKSE